MKGQTKIPILAKRLIFVENPTRKDLGVTFSQSFNII